MASLEATSPADTRNPFRFTGRDSLAQFTVSFVALGGGALPLPFLIWFECSTSAAWIWVLATAGVAIGLRNRVVLAAHQVTVTRLWCFVPYRRHMGRTIEDVFWGGDWGLEEGAMGVVVVLDGKELHVGSRATAQLLYCAFKEYQAGMEREEERAVDGSSLSKLLSSRDQTSSDPSDRNA
jgi:hypothetical protein